MTTKQVLLSVLVLGSITTHIFSTSRSCILHFDECGTLIDFAIPKFVELMYAKKSAEGYKIEQNNPKKLLNLPDNSQDIDVPCMYCDDLNVILLDTTIHSQCRDKLLTEALKQHSNKK